MLLLFVGVVLTSFFEVGVWGWVVGGGVDRVESRLDVGKGLYNENEFRCVRGPEVPLKTSMRLSGAGCMTRRPPPTVTPTSGVGKHPRAWGGHWARVSLSGGGGVATSHQAEWC